MVCLFISVCPPLINTNPGWLQGSLGEDLQLGGDPVQLLVEKSGSAGPLIQVFSLLAIATSFIGFVLGLSDFISDILGVSVPLIEISRSLLLPRRSLDFVLGLSDFISDILGVSFPLICIFLLLPMATSFTGFVLGLSNVLSDMLDVSVPAS